MNTTLDNFKESEFPEYRSNDIRSNIIYDEDTKVIRMPDPQDKPDPRGTGWVMFDKMNKYRDNIAQINGATGEKQTYGELLHRCIRASIALRARGLTREDYVVTCCYNSFDCVVPFIASIFLGITVAPMDPDLDFEDTVLMMQQSPPKILFASANVLGLIERVMKKNNQKFEIIVFEDVKGYTLFEEFLVPSLEEIYFKPVEITNLKDTVMVVFTSGTTGAPKGTCISHFAYLGQTFTCLNFGFPLDVILLFSSLYWISAVMFLSGAIYNGSTRIIVKRFQESTFWNIINSFKPTFLNIAPHHLLLLAEKGCPSNIDTSSVKYIRAAGAPLRDKQLVYLRTIFPTIDIYPAYGQTELTLFLAGFNPCIPKDRILTRDKPGSCGRGVPGVHYKIVDPETEEALGPYQPGELRLKSEFQLSGYIGEENSKRVWDSQGWVRSGDMMYYDEEYCFYVVDRIKEILKYKQFHVSPVELENIILRHPAVSNVIVIGIPDDTDGDVPMALVTVKGPKSNVDPEEIRKYVDDKVDERKRLRAGVKIIDYIPSTTNGKIRRRDLRDMVVRGEL